MKFVLLGLLSACILGSTAQADMKVFCWAKGMKTSHSGSMLMTDAKLSFVREDSMTIRDVEGVIKVGSIDADEELRNDNAYVGLYKLERLAANPKYKPRKYKNFVQFEKFDAYDTVGVETGMWGHLLLSKSMRGGGEAKYIFKAGDHMGGTIHMSCKAKVIR